MAFPMASCMFQASTIFLECIDILCADQFNEVILMNRCRQVINHFQESNLVNTQPFLRHVCLNPKVWENCLIITSRVTKGNVKEEKEFMTNTEHFWRLIYSFIIHLQTDFQRMGWLSFMQVKASLQRYIKLSKFIRDVSQMTEKTI